MPRYSESDIDIALSAIVAGQSIRKASIEYGIPYTTLRSRYTGSQPRRKAQEPFQRLSDTQEAHLSGWVLTQAALGLPPTHQELRNLAGRILEVKGDPRPLGKRWIQGFLDRHPSLKVQRPLRIDLQRINGATTAIIREWWQRLDIPEVRVIKPQNRWNMDEAGILEGQGSNGLVLGSRFTKAIFKKQPGTRGWTTFIECISATGRALPPLVIFKGKSVQQQWFPTNLDQYKSWHFTVSKNGWTNNDITLQWLETVFLPTTKPTRPTEARLLVIDGHGSHTTPDFMAKCFENNVYVVYLPAHASHVLQPLDLAVFSTLKEAYRRQLSKTGEFNDSTVIGKRLFLASFYQARQKALTVQIITSGWRATGLWPVNIAKPLLSPLLLENRNSRMEQHITTPPNNSKKRAKSPINPGETSNFDQNASIVVWKTPNGSKEVTDQLVHYTQLTGSNSTQRLLFSKLRKSSESKDLQLATALARIEALEAQLEVTAPRKKRRVVPDPNSTFVGLREIQCTQVEAGAIEEMREESSDSDNSGNIMECIVVE